MRLLLCTCFIALFFVSAHAANEDIQIGLSDESVAITSSFDGEDVLVFGSIENGDAADLAKGNYDVVVVIAGPDEDLVVRRKERRYGIWVNTHKRAYLRVPSFYSLSSNRPLSEIAEPPTLRRLRLGFDNIQLPEDTRNTPDTDPRVFRASLSRLRAAQDLASIDNDGVKFLSTSLFRTHMAVPANVPIGQHTAIVYLFKHGEFVVRKSARLSVRKIGFEQFTYDLAHNNGLLYGILAVLIAIATGWVAGVVFRKD